MLIDRVHTEVSPEPGGGYDYFERRGDILFAEVSNQAFIDSKGATGKSYWITASPFRDADGNIVGAIECTRDITDRKRAEEALREAKEELEERVAARTADLSETVRELEMEVRERVRLETEILKISDMERQRIGQDLHDSLGQTLSGISCLSQVLYRKLAAKSIEEAGQAAQIQSLLADTVDLSRSLARGLNPVGMTPESLMAGMEELASNTANMFGVECVFRYDCPVLIHDAVVAAHLYYIAQEAANNAVRHGRAKRIEIALESTDGATVLNILDDGVGICENASSSSGMGLRIMKYRADSIGASIDIRRRAQGGTAVTCRFNRAASGKE